MAERLGGVAEVGAGLRVGENISYYILTVFSLTFLVDVASESRALALEALLIGAAVQFFAIPAFARLSDRIGRRPVYAFGGLGLAGFVFVFFNMLASGDTALIVAAIVIGLVLHSAMYGPQAAFITEQFPTRLRYSGVSIAYQLTSIAAGSLAPIIALWLYKDYRSATPVAIYVGVACAVSGRYGPYVTDGTTNATIPKDIKPEDISEAQAVELIDARAAKGPAKKKGRKAPAKKKAAPKKKAAAKKKSPAKKDAD